MIRRRSSVMNIVILGVEGTDKTQLARALTTALATQAPGCTLMTATEVANAKNFDVILLMGLDSLPLVNDCDPSATNQRRQDDALLRQDLEAANLNYVVIYGQGAARAERALQAILQAMFYRAGLSGQAIPTSTPWQWPCDKCSDGACEHRLFTRLLKPDAVRPTAPNR